MEEYLASTPADRPSFIRSSAFDVQRSAFAFKSHPQALAANEITMRSLNSKFPLTALPIRSVDPADMTGIIALDPAAAPALWDDS